MAPDDFCRLCKRNMREEGPSTYGHSTDMFSRNKAMTISDRLAVLGLIVAQEPERSNRCCSRCTSVITRLEKDLPVFRQWEEDFRDNSAPPRPREPTPPETPRDVNKMRPPNPPSASGKPPTTTQVTIVYPSQTMTRVCDPEEDPIIKFLALKRWKEAATHALKHQHLLDELKHGLVKLIRKECEALCAPKNDFMLWKSKPADLKSFSFTRLRADLCRLAPFLLTILNCISNENNFAACTAAAVAIRGRQPRLAALSYWINAILQKGGAKKAVFNELSQLCVTTSYKRAVKKQQEVALGSGGEVIRFDSALRATDTELVEESDEDVRVSGVQTDWLSPECSVNEEIQETPRIKEEPEEEQLPEFTTVYVTGQESEESEEQSDNSFESDDEEDWEAPASSSTAQMETEADGDHYNQVQIKDTSPAAHNSGLFSKYKCGAESRATVTEGHGEKRYECAFCQKKLKSKQSLERHNRVHTGEKPYSCPVCQKTFAQKSNLNAHVRIHTGEKSYSCPFCEQMFTYNSQARRHMKIHMTTFFQDSAVM